MVHTSQLSSYWIRQQAWRGKVWNKWKQRSRISFMVWSQICRKKIQNNILYNRYLNVQNSFKIVVWTEFSQHPSITENVTVITCGRDVKILQYYSTNYTKISECVGNAFKFSKYLNINKSWHRMISLSLFFFLDKVECSGRSPLGAGLVLCFSGIWSGMTIIDQLKPL